MTNCVTRRLVCVSDDNICNGSMSCFINIYDCVNKKMVKVFCQIWTQRQIIYGKKNDFVLQKQCMPLHYISQFHNPTYLQDTHTILPVECLIWGAYVFPKPRYFQQHPLKLQKNSTGPPLRLLKTSNCTPLGPEISNSTPCLEALKNLQLYPLIPPIAPPRCSQKTPTAPLELNCFPSSATL